LPPLRVSYFIRSISFPICMHFGPPEPNSPKSGQRAWPWTNRHGPA